MSKMFSAEELKIPKNQHAFFDRIEQFLLETHPYRCVKYGTKPLLAQRCHPKASFIQIVPIMNSIEDFLQTILDELASTQNLTQPQVNEHQPTFTRAANLYHRIIVELGIPKQFMSGMPTIPCSYLQQLVAFLLYSRDPLYALKICDSMLLFIQKLYKLKKTLPSELISDFSHFTQSFLLAFKQLDFHSDNFLLKITSDLFEYATQADYWMGLLDAFAQVFPREQQYNLRNWLFDQIPVMPGFTAKSLGLRAAGEICFMSLIKASTGSKPRGLEIVAIAAAAYEIIRNIQQKIL